MKKLEIPTTRVSEVFPKCIEHSRKKVDWNNLLPMLENQEKEYIQYASGKNIESFSFLTEDDLKTIGAQKADVEYLYKSFYNDEWDSRDYYLKLLNSSKRCAYCGQNRVKNLDHYLPQSQSLGTTITPVNLIPSCEDCNNEKRDVRKIIWHPYFDDVIEFRWLYARFNCDKDIEYYVSIPSEFKETRNAKLIENSFMVLPWGSIYSAWAISLMEDIEYQMKSLKSVGRDVLRAELWARKNSAEKADKNSYSTALYEFLSDSDEYYEML